jgi:hypothetical protein
MPRAESESKFTGLSKDVGDLQDRVDKYENMKQGGSLTIIYIGLILSLLLNVALFVKTFIPINFQKSQSQSQSKN